MGTKRKWKVQRIVGGPEDFEQALNDPPAHYVLHSWNYAIDRKTECYTIIWRDLELI